MEQLIIKSLNKLGMFPKFAEVREATKEASQMLWKNNIEVELPALIVVVEDILFSTDKYFTALNKSEGH